MSPHLPAEEGFIALQKAAEHGDAKAQFELATAFFRGIDVEQDYQQAFKWYQQAAEQGMPAAQHNLGHAYTQGLGVSADANQAIYWYRKAAEQGDWRAQNNLANAYRLGKGVTQDHQQAVQWYQQAAEHGYAVAQNNLALAYSQGQGVEQNIQEAIKWYQKAAEQGYAEAHKNLLALLKQQNRSLSTTVATEQASVQATASAAVLEQPEAVPGVQRDALGAYTLALHYARNADEAWIQRLAQFLEQQGYQVDPITQVNVHLDQPQWDIRFYDHPQAAHILKQYIQTFMKNNPSTQHAHLEIKNFQFLRKGQQIRQGRLEIWLLNPKT
ncbi:MAG: tetratricopeptide repeat protein [Pseudomonadota bacterium]|nr:tetratricopeptide repeat protein [Pseudomonadota bacterium]